MDLCEEAERWTGAHFLKKWSEQEGTKLDSSHGSETEEANGVAEEGDMDEARG